MKKFQLYHGDCLQVMKQFPDNYFDACVTDPPYGIGATKMTLGNGKTKIYRGSTEWDNEPPTKKYFDEILRMSKHQIIWGGNYFADRLPVSKKWLVWDKGTGDNDFADCELAWTSLDGAIRKFFKSWVGANAKNYDKREHPTEKAIPLMRWCIKQLPKDTETIIDPFMGSGTTGVACAQLGRSFVGIELDADYFEIAKKRIENAYAQPTLFEPVADKIETQQTNLL